MCYQKFFSNVNLRVSGNCSTVPAPWHQGVLGDARIGNSPQGIGNSPSGTENSMGTENAVGIENSLPDVGCFVILDPEQYPSLDSSERVFEIVDWYDNQTHGRLYQLRSLKTGLYSSVEFHSTTFDVV